jgi:hypothetical protein
MLKARSHQHQGINRDATTETQASRKFSGEMTWEDRQDARIPTTECYIIGLGAFRAAIMVTNYPECSIDIHNTLWTRNGTETPQSSLTARVRTRNPIWKQRHRIPKKQIILIEVLGRETSFEAGNRLPDEETKKFGDHDTAGVNHQTCGDSTPQCAGQKLSSTKSEVAMVMRI